MDKQGRSDARSMATFGLHSVQDIGATLGGAGAFTRAVSSKMKLDHWSQKKIFTDVPRGRPVRGDAECFGNLGVSHTSKGGQPFPPISEEGRVFLLEQLKRLGDDHLRAIFTVARVEELGDENRYKDPEASSELTGIDAWSAALKPRFEKSKQSAAPHSDDVGTSASD